MEYKRLIVLEGIDCSGKSMYAKMLAEHFNKIKFKSREWIHQHEPTFSSEDADKLNFSGMDTWRREYYFMKDRMNHQVILNSSNTVLDRYILSGLAYAQVFSPEAIPMMKSVYSNAAEFMHPDLTFFVDMDPYNALAINDSRKGTPDYNPKLTLETLEKLRAAFETHLQTMREWELPVMKVQPFFGDIPRTFDSIFNWCDKSELI